MKIILDSNLLLLLIVGSADLKYIRMHKRLGAYDKNSFVLLTKYKRSPGFAGVAVEV